MTLTHPAATTARPPVECLRTAAESLLQQRLRLVEVLADRPVRDGVGRSTVAVLAPADGGPAVVAKAGPADLVAVGAQAQRAAGTGLTAGLAVPTVLAHDPAGVLVMTRADGEPLLDLLHRGHLDAAHRVGAALAALHRTDPGAGIPALRLADHLADLVSPAPDDLAGTGLPADLVRLARTARRSVLSAAGPPAARRLLHRDLHPGQVLVAAGRTWLLDWDHAAVGDPALDLGNLVGTLRTKLPPAVAGAAVGALLAGYRPYDTTRAVDRLPAHEAFTYLRLACKRARRGAAAAGAVEDLLVRTMFTLTAGGLHG